MSATLKLTVGVIYKFTFIPGFVRCNGIYRLLKIMTYNESVNEASNLFSGFFQYNNKTNEEFDAALPELRESRILKLYKLNLKNDGDSNILYVPEEYIQEFPDHNVKTYRSYGMILDIGVIDNIDLLETIRDNIIMEIESATGITTDPKFVSLGETWLTDTEFEALEHSRDQDKINIKNYFNECIKLNKEVQTEKSRFLATSELVLALQKHINKLEEQLTYYKENWQPIPDSPIGVEDV